MRRLAATLSLALVGGLAACDSTTGGSPSAPERDAPSVQERIVVHSGAQTPPGGGLLAERSGVPAPPDAQANAAPAGAPPNGFPVVQVRADHRGGNGQGPIVTNLADALARVAPGGTVRVFPGTYIVDDLFIDRSVTIEGSGGARPLIRNESAEHSFLIFALPEGSVTFRGLDFELVPGSRASIEGRFEYPEVLVEDCRFEAFDSQIGVAAGTNNTGNGIFRVRNSSFAGGLAGVFAFGEGVLDVRSSRFGEHTVSGLQFQTGSRGYLEGNAAEGCGNFGCVRTLSGSSVDVVRNRFNQTRDGMDPFFHHVVLAAESSTVRVQDNDFERCSAGSCILAISGAHLEAVGNRFTARPGEGTRFAIIGSDGSGGTAVPLFPAPTLLVTDNVITGIGGDPNVLDGYPFEIAAIASEHGAVVTAQRNTITNAQRGLQTFSNGTFLDSRDNRVDLVWWGMTMFFDSRVDGRFNDVTRAVEAFAVHDSDLSESDLTCTWWGSAGGPSGHPASAPASLFTPWATAPIAGTGAGGC